MKEYELIISDNSDLTEQQLQEVTRAACTAMQDFEARLKTRNPLAGSKSGEVITVGAIILTFIKSGLAAKFIEKIASVFDKRSTLKATIKRADGATLEISAPQIQSTEYSTTIALIENFIRP
ncbi:MAG TPA: hypothetical protein VG796_00540 [Verrucomicrobiales bacterium]|jgi:hypothetical protein|nr:hypothetical protein [Verrucomicrobiales bacterium]